jgi:CYTH domain-containing protein
LAPHEFHLLSALPGKKLTKTRYRLRSAPSVAMSIDQYELPLEGLVLVEAEFNDDETMASFPVPEFAIREVTDDPRYRGSWLVLHGIPQER